MAQLDLVDGNDDYEVEKEFDDIEPEDDSDGSNVLKYSITSYGADYPVDALVKRLNNQGILIPDFQRSYVWTWGQASRFVESLILGLPVPGIFFSKEEETQKLLVIDGQQRLKSLKFFYNGVIEEGRSKGKEFALLDVQEDLEGLTYELLPPDVRQRLDDAIIHATVIRQDEPSADQSSIYHIFERLNTGGNLLTPQEIRACIYFGEFNDLVKQLNKYPAWRKLYGASSLRMKDQEFILRFFALKHNLENYEKPMKEFLNKFMGGNRHCQNVSKDLLSLEFEETVGVIWEHIGERAFKLKTKISAAVFDSVMIGVCTRLSHGKLLNGAELAEKHAELLSDSDYKDACGVHTTDIEKVKRRIELAVNAFSDVQ